MRVLKINADNLEEHLDDLISVNDEFLVLVCNQEPRAAAESRAILEEMVAAPSTGVLLARDDQGLAIGMSYYNYGTGYSCGGVYFWLNGIYVRPEHQRKDYGSRLLDYMIGEGLARGMKLFICSRHFDNDASRRLFTRAGFSQNDQCTMSKEFA